MRPLLFLLIPCCLAQIPQPGAVKISEAELFNADFDHRTEVMTFEILNRGTKAISGIEIYVWRLQPDGASQMRPGTASYSFGPARPPGAPGSAMKDPSGPLEPGDTRQFRQIWRSVTAPGSVDPAMRKLELALVKFVDGTCVGAPELTAKCADEQSARAGEWARWLPRIEALAEAPDSYAALRQLYQDVLQTAFEEDMAAFDQYPGMSSRHHAENIRRNIGIRIRNLAIESRLRSGASSIDPGRLAQWIEQMKSEATRAR